MEGDLIIIEGRVSSGKLIFGKKAIGKKELNVWF
jgi:hypothetical protein